MHRSLTPRRQSGPMVRANRYLHKRCGRRRSGERYYLRVPVPADLRAVFGRLIERPLRTSDPRVARIRRDALLPEIRAAFDRARQEPKLEDVLGAVRRLELARAHADWSGLIANRGLSDARELFGMLDEDDDPYWERRARQALMHHGRKPDPSAVGRAAGAIFGAHVDGAEMALDGRVLETARQAATAVARPLTSGTLRSPTPTGSLNFQDAAERYVGERRRDGWTEQTAVQAESTFKKFAANIHNKPIGAVTRQDVADWLGGLRTSARTVNRHAGALVTLFRWARTVGLIDGENPAEGQRRRESTARKRHPFTPAELRTLLEAPDVRPRRHTVAAALPWLVWLGAYTGARLNELCGLRVEDVREADGILYLDLVDHPGRRLKTPAAARRVPVHSAILTIGFREYVERVRGQEYLFPGLTPGGPDGKRSWQATKAFTRLRRRLGLNRPGLVFHSLRNTVATALHEAGVPETEAAALLGHEIRTLSYGLYSGGLSLARLRDAVERVRYPGP